MQRPRVRCPARRVTTFVLVPSSATRIFKTFLCASFNYDDSGDVRSYLNDDLDLRCDAELEGATYSDMYGATRRVALVMIGIWPIG
eukprot:1383591-Prymnesium_polylepis.1